MLALSAKAEIQDPQNILPQLDQFLQNTSLIDAFHAGDTYTATEKDCTGSMCDTVHLTMKVKVENGVAKIDTYIGDSSSASSETAMDGSRWTQFHGNALRIHLAAVESYGFKIQVDASSVEKINVTVNGIKKDMDAMRVHFTGVNGVGQKLEKTFLMAPLPGLAQAIYFEDNPGGFMASKKIYQVNEFSREM
jgi:hypothetical protein